jgi:hypothetical protein
MGRHQWTVEITRTNGRVVMAPASGNHYTQLVVLQLIDRCIFTCWSERARVRIPLCSISFWRGSMWLKFGYLPRWCGAGQGLSNGVLREAIARSLMKIWLFFVEWFFKDILGLDLILVVWSLTERNQAFTIAWTNFWGLAQTLQKQPECQHVRAMRMIPDGWWRGAKSGCASTPIDHAGKSSNRPCVREFWLCRYIRSTLFDRVSP